MARVSETALYGPIKAFLEEQGYEVKGEVQGCDVAAVRGEDILVVELKAAMSLALVLQGVNRLGMTDLVYLAIPAPRRAQMKRWPETIQLCRRLGLGLLTVRLRARGGPRVEVAADPLPYQPRRAKVRRERLLREFERRSGDHNVGGSNKRRLVTAYREDALRIAAMLRDCGPSKVTTLREATGCEKAGPMLRDNYYGWFAREERGVYRLTPSGEEALAAYAEVLAGSSAAGSPAADRTTLAGATANPVE
jgi:hypothetical protein